MTSEERLQGEISIAVAHLVQYLDPEAPVLYVPAPRPSFPALPAVGGARPVPQLHQPDGGTRHTYINIEINIHQHRNIMCYVWSGPDLSHTLYKKHCTNLWTGLHGGVEDRWLRGDWHGDGSSILKWERKEKMWLHTVLNTTDVQNSKLPKGIYWIGRYIINWNQS